MPVITRHQIEAAKKVPVTDIFTSFCFLDTQTTADAELLAVSIREVWPKVGTRQRGMLRRDLRSAKGVKGVILRRECDDLMHCHYTTAPVGPLSNEEQTELKTLLDECDTSYGPDRKVVVAILIYDFVLQRKVIERGVAAPGTALYRLAKVAMERFWVNCESAPQGVVLKQHFEPQMRELQAKMDGVVCQSEPQEQKKVVCQSEPQEKTHTYNLRPRPQ